MMQNSLTSLSQLPEGQLTPKQMQDVHAYLVQRGFQKDYQDFQDAFKRASKKGKGNLMRFVGEAAHNDAASPATGIPRRQAEVLTRLGTYGSPDDQIVTPKIKLKIINGLTPVQGQWGSKAGTPKVRQI